MQKKLLIFCLYCLLLGSSFKSASAYADKYVNVLTWWGYLDSPWIAQMVKDKCGVTLSYDTYNSNDELLRRWNAQSDKYDVLIFSDTIYNILKDQIVLKNSKVYQQSSTYNPIIRKHYILSHFPPNVAYFLHSLTGFIWNPGTINLNEDDTISSIFTKAKSNMVVLIDDPIEVYMLLTSSASRGYQSNDEALSWNNFKNITQNAQIFISNELNQVYDQAQFAFAFQWSGIALAELQQKPQYQFLINKNLSYISSDLIAQLKDNPSAACVAELFSSKLFLSRLQNEAYYFSPYGDIEHVSDGKFKDFYRQFLITLPMLAWIEPASMQFINRLNYQWSMIKYKLTK